MLLNALEKRSYLMLIGGAEDKKRDKKVLKRVIETAKAQTVIVVPSASGYPREVYDKYYDAFRELGVANVENFDIRYPDEADKPEYFEKLQQAQLIFFSGGDQVKLVKTFEGTELLKEIKRRFYAGSLHIAGTSAGSAAASNPMIYDGDYEGFNKDSVNYSMGFGFLPGITVDTHFVTRGRISRLTQFLLTGRSMRGIGLGEDTGIIIDENLKFEVVGSGMVTVINGEKTTHSNYDEIESGAPYSVNNLRVGFLADGTSFSIKKWSILRTSVNPKKKELAIEDSYVIR